MLGSQATLFLSPRLRLRLRLFALGDMGWLWHRPAGEPLLECLAGFGYAIGNSTQPNLCWRLLPLGGSNGAPQSNAFAVNNNGVGAGVKVCF